MRQIKFRVWFPKNKKMSIFSDQHFNYEYGLLAFSSETEEYQGICNLPDDYDEGVVEQYTGLTDKNGKEVYEGDIVKDSVDGKIGKVEWDYSYMKWDVGADGYWAEDRPYVHNFIEIIGNIHQNPELLK